MNSNANTIDVIQYSLIGDDMAATLQWTVKESIFQIEAYRPEPDAAEDGRSEIVSVTWSKSSPNGTSRALSEEVLPEGSLRAWLQEHFDQGYEHITELVESLVAQNNE